MLNACTALLLAIQSIWDLILPMGIALVGSAEGIS